jgi:NAD+--asparagine ADP-ribosyltransferase
MMAFLKLFFFTCTTWESEINKKDPSKIYPSPPSNFLVIPPNYFKNYKTNTFFWENFKNEKKDFLKLDSLLKSISNQSIYLNEKSSSKFNVTYLLNFCWNNKEIISRKATDLVEIDIKTYKSYLSEMKSKYSPPKKINQTTASKPQNQGIGTEITGKMILEIPDSNRSFSDINNYINIAKSYGIEIKFSPE